MLSHSLKRVASAALAACAVTAALGVPQTSATAAPSPALQQPPSSASDALQKYRELAGKAEKLNEAYLRAKEDLAATQKKLDKANGSLDSAKDALAHAKEDEEQFRDRVDQLAGASFSSGAQFTKLSVLLSGEGTKEFLDRSAALDVLAKQKVKVLDKLSNAVSKAKSAKQQASEARSDAQEAKDKAVKLLSDIETRKDKLDEQISKVKSAANGLNSADKAAQQDTGGAAPDINAPGPAAQAAIDAALGQRGTPYEWGGTTPSGFDCSGLVQWAYGKAGVNLPRTTGSQAKVGTPVPRDQLKPGDLVYYYSPVTHIGIYIGDGKMVHAPTSGDVVKISPIMSGYQGATRVS